MALSNSLQPSWAALPRTFFIAVIFFSFILSGCATWKLGNAGQQKMAGKTFVIIGASSGFGRGVAEQLGSYKANVVLAARRTELLEEVAGKVRAAGGTAMVVTMDISNAEEVQRLADTAIKQFGHIDVWVNIAGLGAIGPFWDIPLQDQARLVDINLKGVLYASYAAMRQFKRQGYGTLINMGSIESEVPLAYHATYAATKAGIRGLDQAINQELRKSHQKEIEVVTIEPWATDTPFFDHAANYTDHTLRMAAMDPPSKVVNAILRRSLRPRKEQPVGWKSRSSWIAHHLLPHFTEKISANMAYSQHYKKAMPAPPTAGSLYQPLQNGRGIEGGVQERMKKENRERKKQKKNSHDQVSTQ